MLAAVPPGSPSPAADDEEQHAEARGDQRQAGRLGHARPGGDDIAFEVQGDVADELVEAARIAALDSEIQHFVKAAERGGVEPDVEAALGQAAGEAADRIAGDVEARARQDRPL